LSNVVWVAASLECGSRRAAETEDVVVGKLYTACCERVNVRRTNVAAIRGGLEPQIVPTKVCTSGMRKCG
jgi:hypothetical protein